MNLFEILNENRLATASVVLGILAIVVFFVMFGTVNVFLYLGIPAVVLGVISLTRLKKQRGQLSLASILLPIAGIILGVLPVFFTFFAIY